MTTGPETLAVFPMLFGNTMNIDQQFLRRLKQRLQITQVNTAPNSDVVMAFVPILSQEGTDIETALQQIPRTGQPVVFVGLHFTFDENYIAPQSNWNISRDDVFAVDLLCYEDLGMIRCLRNDMVLKAVTDRLISIGGTPNTQVEAPSSQRQVSSPVVIICISLSFALGIMIAIAFSIYMRQWSHHISPTMQPYTTINTTLVNTTSQNATFVSSTAHTTLANTTSQSATFVSSTAHTTLANTTFVPSTAQTTLANSTFINTTFINHTLANITFVNRTNN